jgi:predicted transcriptional regulator
MEIRDMIDELKEIEQEIRDLKRENAQLESFCAVIVKNSKEEIKFNYKDLFKSDYKKVRLFTIDEDKGEALVKYIEDFEDEKS